MQGITQPTMEQLKGAMHAIRERVANRSAYTDNAATDSNAHSSLPQITSDNALDDTTMSLPSIQPAALSSAPTTTREPTPADVNSVRNFMRTCFAYMMSSRQRALEVAAQFNHFRSNDMHAIAHKFMNGTMIHGTQQDQQSQHSLTAPSSSQTSHPTAPTSHAPSVGSSNQLHPPSLPYNRGTLDGALPVSPSQLASRNSANNNNRNPLDLQPLSPGPSNKSKRGKSGKNRREKDDDSPQRKRAKTNTSLMNSSSSPNIYGNGAYTSISSALPDVSSQLSGLNDAVARARRQYTAVSTSDAYIYANEILTQRAATLSDARRMRTPAEIALDEQTAAISEELARVTAQRQRREELSRRANDLVERAWKEEEYYFDMAMLRQKIVNIISNPKYDLSLATETALAEDSNGREHRSAVDLTAADGDDDVAEENDVVDAVAFAAAEYVKSVIESVSALASYRREDELTRLPAGVVEVSSGASALADVKRLMDEWNDRESKRKAREEKRREREKKAANDLPDSSAPALIRQQSASTYTTSTAASSTEMTVKRVRLPVERRVTVNDVLTFMENDAQSKHQQMNINRLFAAYTFTPFKLNAWVVDTPVVPKSATETQLSSAATIPAMLTTSMRNQNTLTIPNVNNNSISSRSPQVLASPTNPLMPRLE